MSVKGFVKKFFTKFIGDDTPTLAASLAFYTALSLAPLLILFVTISAHLNDDLLQSFLVHVRGIVGSDAAQAINMVINSARTRSDLTSMANAMGGLTLLISAGLIFGQLRSTLNRIFAISVPAAKDHSYILFAWGMVKERLMQIGLALCFILTLIFSLTVSAFVSRFLPVDYSLAVTGLRLVFGLAFYIMLFTLLFRYLPDRRLPWKRALQAGTLTSILFIAGKEFIAFYLGTSAVGSSYGAAGSVIVLLVWVYYSTLITFVGAQFISIFYLAERKAKNTQL